MKAQIPNILHFCRDVLLADLGIFCVVVASFLFTGEFSLQRYSDRLLWAGIAAVLVGGAGGIFGGLAAGLHGSAQDSPDSSGRAVDARYAGAKHHHFAFRLWAIGLVCIAASALVGRFLAR